MIAYAIKIKEDCYWLGGFYGKNNYGDLVHSKIFVTERQAITNCASVNDLYGYDAKVVKVEIKEVEDEA